MAAAELHFRLWVRVCRLLRGARGHESHPAAGRGGRQLQHWPRVRGAWVRAASRHRQRRVSWPDWRGHGPHGLGHGQVARVRAVDEGLAGQQRPSGGQEDEEAAAE